MLKIANCCRYSKVLRHRLINIGFQDTRKTQRYCQLSNKIFLTQLNKCNTQNLGQYPEYYVSKTNLRFLYNVTQVAIRNKVLASSSTKRLTKVF